MKLNELLTLASPRPWELREELGQIVTPRGAGIASVLEGPRGERGVADMQLIEHCVNTYPELVESLSYPRHGNAADLLEQAADLIETLQSNTEGVSYFTLHLRRAAQGISIALEKATNINIETKGK